MAQLVPIVTYLDNLQTLPLQLIGYHLNIISNSLFIIKELYYA